MFERNPLWSPVAILIVALALSIGWGIRGNYGHELGAMLPGGLAAVAACVLSGREDWRRRVPFFALFGALGWGFGGSISYMQVIGYTHTNHVIPGREFDFFGDSTFYGFACLFGIGFLWAAVGGGATALPACLDRRRLTDLVYSFLPLFALWIGIYLMDMEVIKPVEWARVVQQQFSSSLALADQSQKPVGADAIEPPKMARHEDPLYWLDSDWLNVSIILSGILLFDLVERRGRGIGWLALLAGLGSLAGVGAQYLCQQMGWTESILNSVVHVQGDPARFPIERLPTNWPTFLQGATGQIGWGIGLLLGIAAYFTLFGRFAYGSLFYLHLAVGWLLGFLGIAVLGNLHMTPPRGDSWAGIAGMLVAGWIYFLRERWTGPLWSSIVAGAIGGLGFAGATWLKLLAVSFGNSSLTDDPAVVADWAHFQGANWHSFLEQSYGFINGIGAAIALAVLVRRIPEVDDSHPRRRWAEVFAFFFVLPVLTYTNMVKNLRGYVHLFGSVDGRGGHQALPSEMTAPLFSSVELSAWGWFTLLFGFVTAGMMILAWVQSRRPIAMIPESWAGRGQLLFFLLCWVFVIGNFGKALVAFDEQRLLTEGVILVNAVVVTVLLLATTRSVVDLDILPNPRWWLVGVVSTLLTIGLAVGLPYGMTYHVRSIYGTKSAGHSGKNIRWGEDANWRAEPNLKGVPHR